MEAERPRFISRRTVLRYGVGGAVAALLVGCGSDDSNDSAQSASGSSSTGGGSTTKAVDTIFGKVDVPTDPQRIVCLGFVDTACILEVGLVPVGMTTSGVNFLPEYEAVLAGIPDVVDASSFEYKMELIASLNPDLIIGSDWVDASKQSVDFGQMSQIAPTAICEWKQAAGNWPEQSAFFADVVGRTAELDALERNYNQRADTIKSQRSAALAAHDWALIQGGDGEWYHYTEHSSHGQVFTRAGATLAPINQGSTDGFVTMSLERINELAVADAIAINVNESAAAGSQALQAQPLFATLPATTAGHVYPMTWFFPSSYKVATALLDELDAALAKL